jgi:hypothetical protein
LNVPLRTSVRRLFRKSLQKQLVRTNALTHADKPSISLLLSFRLSCTHGLIHTRTHTNTHMDMTLIMSRNADGSKELIRFPEACLQGQHSESQGKRSSLAHAGVCMCMCVCVCLCAYKETMLVSPGNAFGPMRVIRLFCRDLCLASANVHAQTQTKSRALLHTATEMQTTSHKLTKLRRR